MTEEFYSCINIEAGLVINNGHSLLPCCVNNIKDSNYTFDAVIAKWNGGLLPLYKILLWREVARVRNQQGGMVQCKGCPFLQKSAWNEKYLFSQMTMNHFVKCNLNCSYCSCPSFMHEEEIDIVPAMEYLINLNYLNPKANIFWAGGEPTLSRHFESALNLLADYGTNNMIGTNAVVFSEIVKEALSRKRASIVVSLDAGTPETYKKIKGHDFFDRVVRNITEYAKTDGEVIAKMIIMPENSAENEVISFVEVMGQSGVKTLIYDVNNKDPNQSQSVIDAIKLFIHEAQKRNIEMRKGAGIIEFNSEIKDKLDSEDTRSQHFFSSRIWKRLLGKEFGVHL